MFYQVTVRDWNDDVIRTFEAWSRSEADALRFDYEALGYNVTVASAGVLDTL